MSELEHDRLLKEVCSREIECGLYDVKIDGIGVYNYIRRDCRDRFMSGFGLGEGIGNPYVPINERRKSLLISFWHFIKIAFGRIKANNVIRSFERIELVNGLYVDKFTDPFVDFSSIKESYIIIDPGRNGRHLKPREHQNNIVYPDAIYWLSSRLLRFKFIKKSYIRKNVKVLDELFIKLNKAFPEFFIDRNSTTCAIIEQSYVAYFYRCLFKKLKSKSLFAPARGSFMHIIPAAKLQGIRVFELQHGVTYGESLTYSGYLDPLFSPDFFLAFSKITNPHNYGMAADRVVEVGWAFEKYLALVEEQGSGNSVLVISSPEISEKMIAVTSFLASQNPSVKFSFRPHPNEMLDEGRLKELGKYDNIEINNNLENLSVVLTRFSYIIGENSTALYEGLNMGKNVGKLFLGGLQPRYLDEDDKKYFFAISNNEDFLNFIRSQMGIMPSRKLYEPYNNEVFERAILK